MESRSGRARTPRKRVTVQAVRGFKSHLHRRGGPDESSGIRRRKSLTVWPSLVLGGGLVVSGWPASRPATRASSYSGSTTATRSRRPSSAPPPKSTSPHEPPASPASSCARPASPGRPPERPHRRGPGLPRRRLLQRVHRHSRPADQGRSNRPRPRPGTQPARLRAARRTGPGRLALGLAPRAPRTLPVRRHRTPRAADRRRHGAGGVQCLGVRCGPSRRA